MLGLNGKAPFGLQAAALTQEAPKFPSGLLLPWDGSPSEEEALRRRRRRHTCLSDPQGHILGGGFEEEEESLMLFARTEALAAAAGEHLAPAPAPSSSSSSAPSPGQDQPPFKPGGPYRTMSILRCPSPTLPHHHHHSHHPHPHRGLDVGGVGDPLLEHLSPAALMGAPEVLGAQMPPNPPPPPPPLGHLHQALAGLGHPPPPPPPPSSAARSPPSLPGEAESDPRELEAFAERFKQRRIKLGVTQADVGAALGSLKIPGVGPLSQSTICRFESLTLSHNNMVALKPVLRAWLQEAEAAQRESQAARDPGAAPGAGAGAGSGPVLALGLGLGLDLDLGAERKRRRTSIAAPEKRSLEAYFALQPRPSSEKIAAIAEKLDLKKNVVRVWFCNQRQKQKRMKYSALH